MKTGPANGRCNGWRRSNSSILDFAYSGRSEGADLSRLPRGPELLHPGAASVEI